MTVSVNHYFEFNQIRSALTEEYIFTRLGGLVSMKHLKNEVESIKKDVECGLQLNDKYVAPEEGDTIICYTLKREKPKIDWNPF